MAEKEYIERGAAINRLLSVAVTGDVFGMGVQFGVDHAIAVLNDAPAADVVEVKHGRWITRNKGQNNWCECSVCNTVGSPFWKCCPMCEAKMDGYGERKVETNHEDY